MRSSLSKWHDVHDEATNCNDNREEAGRKRGGKDGYIESWRQLKRHLEKHYTDSINFTSLANELTIIGNMRQKSVDHDKMIEFCEIENLHLVFEFLGYGKENKKPIKINYICQLFYEMEEWLSIMLENAYDSKIGVTSMKDIDLTQLVRTTILYIKKINEKRMFKDEDLFTKDLQRFRIIFHVSDTLLSKITNKKHIFVEKWKLQALASIGLVMIIADYTIPTDTCGGFWIGFVSTFSVFSALVAYFVNCNYSLFKDGIKSHLLWYKFVLTLIGAIARLVFLVTGDYQRYDDCVPNEMVFFRGSMVIVNTMLVVLVVSLFDGFPPFYKFTQTDNDNDNDHCDIDAVTITSENVGVSWFEKVWNSIKQKVTTTTIKRFLTLFVMGQLIFQWFNLYLNDEDSYIDDNIDDSKFVINVGDRTFHWRAIALSCYSSVIVFFAGQLLSNYKHPTRVSVVPYPALIEYVDNTGSREANKKKDDKPNKPVLRVPRDETVFYKILFTFTTINKHNCLKYSKNLAKWHNRAIIIGICAVIVRIISIMLYGIVDYVLLLLSDCILFLSSLIIGLNINWHLIYFQRKKLSLWWKLQNAFFLIFGIYVLEFYYEYGQSSSTERSILETDCVLVIFAVIVITYFIALIQGLTWKKEWKICVVIVAIVAVMAPSILYFINVQTDFCVLMPFGHESSVRELVVSKGCDLTIWFAFQLFNIVKYPDEIFLIGKFEIVWLP